MGTSFEEIYCLADSIKEYDKINKLSDYNYYFVMYRFLVQAITMFKYACLKDLNNMTPYQKQEYNYIATSDNVYSLSPTPPQNCLFYVGYRFNDSDAFKETTNYVYDSVAQTITINDQILTNSQVLIVAYVVGSFEQELSIDEKAILAEAIMIPFIERYDNDSAVLQFTMYNGAKMHSQAEHVKSVAQRIKDQIARVRQMINLYSYNSQGDGVKGLGGVYYK